MSKAPRKAPRKAPKSRTTRNTRALAEAPLRRRDGQIVRGPWRGAPIRRAPGRGRTPGKVSEKWRALTNALKAWNRAHPTDRYVLVKV